MAKKIVVHLHTADGDYRSGARKLMEDLRKCVSSADDLSDEMEGAEKAKVRSVRNKIQSAIQELTPLT